MVKTLKEEFTWRSLIFYCTKEEKDLFIESQWFSSRRWFLCYRLFMWAYQLGWTIAFFVWTGVHSPRRLAKNHRYFTNWGDMINALYFTFSFALCLVCFYRRRRHHATESGAVQCMRSVTWIFHTVAVNSSIVVTAVYWGLLAPLIPIERVQSVFSIHVHAMNTVLILIDFTMIATPTRPLHCVYASLYGLLYVFATLLIHWSGETSAVYPFIDWENKPGRAIGIASGLAFISPTLIQFAFYGLYRLRVRAFSSWNHRRDNPKVKIQTIYTAPGIPEGE